MPNYDIAILGAGPGGYVAAIRAAQYGAKVALIEKGDLGGTCLNWGCIPSKALLESVHALGILQNAGDFGLSCSEPGFDLKAIYDRKDAIVERLRGGVAALMKKHKVDVVQGYGRLTGETSIEVTGAEKTAVSAGRIILATGSTPLRPEAFPMDEDTVVTSDYFLALETLPASVLVIGAGYIGCELATVLRGLGCDVTLVEMLDQALPMADADVSKELRKVLKKAGITLHLKTRVEQLAKKGKGIEAKLAGGTTVRAEKALVAIGRSRCTADIGLGAVGIEPTDDGAIAINEHCQTAVPTIYAIGDITDKPQLAHVASKMGLKAAAHATGHVVPLRLDVIPACVFTHPEIGNVGLTEAAAKEAGCDVTCAKFNYRALGKAAAMNETAGFFKIVADAKTGEVLGVHIMGAHATDLIGEAALALQLECTVEEIAHTIHAHPTLHEGLMECAESWLGMGIHG
jgi:dihydrolipoamide dehydrogenase